MKKAPSLPILLIAAGCGSPPQDEAVEATRPSVEAVSRPVDTVVQTEVGFYQEISWRPDGSGLLVSVLEWGSGPDGYSYRIYEIGADGSGFRPLTDGPRDRWTSWSPDGSRIAFASVQADNDDIYTMAADASDWRRLTDDPAVDSHPSYSPDGARIAFISRREGEAELYTMNADGTGQTRLIEAEGEPNNPTWSPDGTRLAFFATDAEGTDHIWVVDADGARSVRIATGVWPSWSADGTKILYGAEGGIYEVDPAGGGSSLVVPGEASFARVSPGGSRIGYIESDSVEVSVHIVGLDGSEHSVLLRRPKPAW